MNALECAVRNDDISWVSKLIESGAKVNRTDELTSFCTGPTPLLFAVQNNNEVMVRLLIDAGADVNTVGDTINERTALFDAVQNNNESMVRLLIDAGAEVNTKCHGETLLFGAVENNNEDMLRLLIDAGADVNISSSSYCFHHETVLQYSVEKNNESMVKLLIAAGADVNSEGNTFFRSRPVLFSAVQNNNEGMVRLLTDAGADANTVGNTMYERTALFDAVQNKNESVIRALIDGGADVDFTDEHGKTPLIHVVENHSEDNANLLRTLIDAGAYVNVTDDKGKTVLFYAVTNRNLSLISALIDAGLDVNISDHQKQTALFQIITEVEKLILLPNKTEILAQIKEGVETIDTAGIMFPGINLHYGAHSTFNNVLQELLDAGTDINSTNETGQTALSKACKCDDFRSVFALIKAGADLEIKNSWGQTALFGALRWCYEGDFRFLDALLAAGADVNTQDKQGKTPLFYAVKNQAFDFSIVQRLIDAGADVNRTDNAKRTALFHFVVYTWPGKKYSDFKHMIDGLLNAGLDVNKVDKDGKSVLCWAAMGNDEELTHRFIEAGADANIPDNRGHTALFHTVMPKFIERKDDEAGILMFVSKPAETEKLNIADVESTHKIIEAGADANIPDIRSKAELFRSPMQPYIFPRDDEYIPAEIEKLKIVRALVEEGKADVNARNILGRTPLFYAIRESSMSITTYLIENGANLLIRDNCGVNVLSFFLESCIVNQYDAPCDMFKVLELFLHHGIKRNAVFTAIVNAVFCKTLIVCFYVSIPSTRNEIRSLFNILKLASDYITEAEDTKKKIIDNILTTVKDESKDFLNFYDFFAQEILSQLHELGANPNSADVDGNTALHYATCLPLYGVSRETVMKICRQLENFGVIFNIRNHQKETPLLFCLSRLNHPRDWELYNRVSKLRNLRDVYTFLLVHGSCADDTTSSGDSVFHLLLDLFQEIFRHFRKGRELEEDEQEEEEVGILLSFFDKRLYVDKQTVNMRKKIKLDSPLHIWATLKVNEIQIGEDTLKTVLNHLLEYGASLNIVNQDGKTPLHVCSSWTAVTLLLDAGASPCVFDSFGRQPLLIAAECGFFNFLEETHPHEFWKSAVKRGLDPWSVDKRGESVLSILIKSEEFVLAEALVEVARDDNHLQSEPIAVSLLNAICKDESRRTHWKSNLVEIILKSVSGTIVLGHNSETSPLHLCCQNIVENYFDEYYVSDKGVHWTIAKLLLSYGADCTIPDSTGKSCLDIAKTNPALKDLLTRPHDIKEVPLLIPWTSISNTVKDKLAKVARRLESKYFKPYWYHKDHLASGSFGAVFAGINEKDGREVAIKRMEKRHMQQPEDKREITNLTALADCEQVVRYLFFFEDENFCYVVLELMEGNLDDYLDGPYFERNQEIKLCKDVMSGLTYLHSQDILHRDLKPSNILYKCRPHICLRIADFGLSRRIDSDCTTVYGTNVGTRCWIAPEVLKSTKAGEQHSKESDIFTCGLVLHYILSVKGHPFASRIGALQHETEANISKGKMEGWDASLCHEAAHLLKAMLDGDKSKRPCADKALDHPFFWSKKKKLDLLIAVGNQPEIECPRSKVTTMTIMTAVENDLEASFGTIVKHVKWNDPGYIHMPAIYTEMMKGRKTPYDPFSTVELVRFIRNAIAHVSGSTRPTPMRRQMLEDFVFLEYFPNLVMEVYNAVTSHGWDQTREEIKYKMKE